MLVYWLYIAARPTGCALGLLLYVAELQRQTQQHKWQSNKHDVSGNISIWCGVSICFTSLSACTPSDCGCPQLILSVILLDGIARTSPGGVAPSWIISLALENGKIGEPSWKVQVKGPRASLPISTSISLTATPSLKPNCNWKWSCLSASHISWLSTWTAKMISGCILMGT